MLCRNPFTQGIHVYRCGQCMPCRVQRRRLWTHRLMLESICHGDSAFLTLTYDPSCVPVSSCGLMVLRPKDLQNWLKRLRKMMEPYKIRYYCVGEYGDETWRPHYHAAVFGLKPCVFGDSRLCSPRVCDCVSCNLVRTSWGHGFVSVGTLELSSAQYLAGYVTKKMTKIDDKRLEGRPPEFARMSLRPGIGFHALHEVADQVMKLGLDVSQADVPSGLRHGGRIMPLGRYLRRKLRLMVGKDESAPAATLAEVEAKVFPLWDAAVKAAEAAPVSERLGPSKVFRASLLAEGAGRVAQMEARQRIFKKRSSI